MTENGSQAVAGGRDDKREVSSTSQSETKQQALQEALKRQFGDKLEIPPAHAWKPFGLTIGVSREDAKEIFLTLKSNEQFLFAMLIDVTAVDWMDKREPRFDVVYQLMSLHFGYRLTIKIQVAEDDLQVDSVRDIWAGANFLEREVWDMYGIDFAGHGDLRRVLLYDEFQGFALRKDYPKGRKQPRVQMRVPELRNSAVDMDREELVSLPARVQPKV